MLVSGRIVRSMGKACIPMPVERYTRGATGVIRWKDRACIPMRECCLSEWHVACIESRTKNMMFSWVKGICVRECEMFFVECMGVGM
jgi:hypothetical protein